MEKPFLNQIDLSRRWGMSPRTLERWRWLGQGPAFIKLGGKVVYRLSDIEAFEDAGERHSTSEISGDMAGVGGLS